MAWITGLIGAAGSGIGSLGANKAAKAQNKFWQSGTINKNAQGMNPWAWDAVQGKQGNGNQFSQDMYNIAQGKDMSSWLLNQPLNQINRGADTNMAKMQSQIGRSNMSGGLANAYSLTNRMGKQNATANLYQNYGQWREQQRRSDMDWLMGLVGKSQQQGGELADKYVFKKNFWEKLGAFGQGFVGGMGGGGMSSPDSKPKDAKSPSPDTRYPSTNFQDPNSPTKYGDWVGAGNNYGQGTAWGADSRTRMGTGVVK